MLENESEAEKTHDSIVVSNKNLSEILSSSAVLPNLFQFATHF